MPTYPPDLVARIMFRGASGTGAQAPTNPVATRPKANPLAGILTNPAVMQADINRKRAIAEANAMLRQLRSQALIRFGDPDLARSLGDAVDPNAAAAAAANQYSTVAELSRANQEGVRKIYGNLAGRHLLRSGFTGYQQGQQALDYGRSVYGARQELLNQLNQYLGAYMGQTQGAQDAYTQALLAAFAQFGQNPLGLANA